MRGHLVKRATGSWSIVLEAPRENGRRKRQWLTVKGTRKAAERRLTELLAQMDSGVPIDRGKLTVNDYMDAWLRDVVAARNRLSTQRGYVSLVRNHIMPSLGHIPLAKLQPEDVERLESAMLAAGLSPSTAHHVHVVLSKALKDAMRKGLVHRNVCQAIDPPKVGRYDVQVPEMDGITRILSLADRTPHGACYRLMAYTGIRRGEAIALRWRNVDMDNGIISIVETAQRVTGHGIVFQSTKSTAGRRGIAIGDVTVERLREHRGRQVLHQVEIEGAYDDNDLVFPGPLGKALDPAVLTRNFEKLATQAEYSGTRLHDLRHGHAAGLIRSGVHPRVVQERLGHASAAFTMQVYGHVSEGLQRDAAKDFEKMMAQFSG